MKLASRLTQQLRKILVLAVGLGATVLILNIANSTNQIKNKANQFILESIEEIAQSEVVSQNVSDIDNEVRKLYEIWRSTQDIDTRIDVFVNGSLVSHAGPLKHFGWLSYSTTKNYQMPNGDALKVLVDLNLASQILFDFLTFAVFFIFLGGGYYLIKRNLDQVVQTITMPLEARVNWLTNASKALSKSVRSYPPFENADLEEVRALDSSLRVFVEQIRTLEEHVAKSNFEKGRMQIAEKFAHSTKGSLGVLRLRIQNAKGLTVEDRQKLNAAVSDVAEASKNLLKPKSPHKDDFKELDLIGILEKIVASRNELLGDNGRIKLLLECRTTRPASVRGSESNLSTAFGNIIDNAIESIKQDGSIQITITGNKNSFEIKIVDNGCGIPKENLPKLMNERVTFGKPEGTGYGLYHTKLDIEELSGKIVIHSEVGEGTKVTVLLPRAVKPIPKNIAINPEGLLVILDDNELIHQTVEQILKKEMPIEAIHLKSVDEFEYWLAANGKGELGSRTYWMDYDLGHISENGLSLIERHSLQLEAYLVTGMADDSDLKQRAKNANVRLISKDDIPNINFFVRPAPDKQEIVLESGLA